MAPPMPEAEEAVVDKTNWFQSLRRSGFYFPKSYLVLDVETTGLNTEFNYIVQFGHLIVEDTEQHQPFQILLDWSNCSSVEHGHMRQRIYEMEHYLAERGQGGKFTYEQLATRGRDPIVVLGDYLLMCAQHQLAGGYFVTHNGVNYDSRIISNHFRRFLGLNFEFNPRRMIDTGLLEKARQMGAVPQSGEPLEDFYYRVYEARVPGVMWSLDRHCIPHYRLCEKYALDATKSHHADFDCLATHKLFEEFRRLSEAA